MIGYRHSNLMGALPVLVVSGLCLGLVHCSDLEDGATQGGTTKTWGTPERLHDRGGFPEVAVDAHGDVTALFGHWLSFGETSTTESVRFTPGEGWSTVEPIDGGLVNGGRAGPRAIAVTPDGDAVAVWHQVADAHKSIWANRYTSSIGWGTAEPIEQDETGDARDPDIAVDPGGHAVAVWHQSDGARDDIWSARYTPTSGWDPARPIEHDDGGDALGPRVAIDPDGNAIAVWHQSDGTRDNIWANRYTPAGGWDIAVRLEEVNAGDAVAPQVAMDASGDAVVVWHQFDGTRFNIWAGRYDRNDGWGDPQRLETSNAGDARNAQVAVSRGGVATAAWEQFDGSSFGIWSNRYTPGNGWGTAEPLETHVLGEALNVQVATDPSGNVMAVWYRDDGTRDNIWANYYAQDHGWGDALRIDVHDTGVVHNPRVAMDSDGNATVLWLVWTTVGDGVFGLWSRRFE